MHLPILINGYYYDEFAIVNLLPFSKIANEYQIICNAEVDDAIYSKINNNEEYFQFERDRRNGLYNFDYKLGLVQLDSEYRFNTVKKSKIQFSSQDQKRPEEERIL